MRPPHQVSRPLTLTPTLTLTLALIPTPTLPLTLTLTPTLTPPLIRTRLCWLATSDALLHATGSKRTTIAELIQVLQGPSDLSPNPNPDPNP